MADSNMQFTQILDILQKVLEQQKIKFLVLTGSTPVDVRQTLVDEFTEDESIQVFLLSTKAGGMGINLTAASVVIMCVYGTQKALSFLIWSLGSIRISILIMTRKRRIVHIA